MVLLGGMIVALSVIRLIPRRRLPVITYLGAGGLYIYLLHPLVLRPLHERDVFDGVGSPAGLLGAVCLATLLSAALASPPLRWLTRPLIQPSVPWLFKPNADPGARPPAKADAGPGSTPDEPSVAEALRPLPVPRRQVSERAGRR
jgi:peptidoglycan/LPS O-acetylase OafA/YrhL